MNTRFPHPSFTRRTFLESLARGGAGACLVASNGLLAQNIDPGGGRLIVHSARPQDLETPSDLLTSWITPNDLFYVRSHFYTPAIREDAWTLRVDGDVDRPLDLTLAELRKMRSVTEAVTLECAGNGRGFFDPPVAGVQWRKGAVGTARWTGVRMADVLERAGVKRSARYVWMNGADVGTGKAPDFIRNVPLDKAMHADTLLAYEMNGEALPVAHGFPVRAVVSGWEGAYSVKWLTHLQVADREHEGPWVQTSYRYPTRPVPPGATVRPADTVPLKGLVVKSIIVSPVSDAVVSRGAVRVAGFAWAGEAEIKRVDVSIDHGRTWSAARLGRDRAPYAWRQFEYQWNASEPGAFVVLSRAEDGHGQVQPVVAVWNPSGYLWNAIDQVRVNVKA